VAEYIIKRAGKTEIRSCDTLAEKSTWSTEVIRKNENLGKQTN